MVVDAFRFFTCGATLYLGVEAHGACTVVIVALTIIGLYKTEVIRKRAPWRNLDEVEYATLEWVDWFNNRRLLESIGDVPPAEFETAYYEQLEGQARAA